MSTVNVNYIQFVVNIINFQEVNTSVSTRASATGISRLTFNRFLRLNDNITNTTEIIAFAFHC